MNAPGKLRDPCGVKPGPEARARRSTSPSKNYDGWWSLPRRESWQVPPKLPGGVGGLARDQGRRCGAGARMGVARDLVNPGGGAAEPSNMLPGAGYEKGIDDRNRAPTQPCAQRHRDYSGRR